MARLLVVAALLASLALLAPAAADAFAGRNGEIAFGWHERDEDELGVRPTRELHALVTVRPRRPRGGPRTELLRCEREGDDARGDCAPPMFAAPAYSPDGTRIAFDAGERLGLVDADGGGLRLLPAAAGDAGHPAFSPTGTRLAFDVVTADGARSLWVASTFGEQPRRLTAGGAPAWSTRNRIAFERGRQVAVVRPGGSGLRHVTARGGRAPAWSPDGRRIAFARGRAGVIRIVRPDGRGLRRVHGPRGVVALRWSPDGRQLVAQTFDGSVLAIAVRSGRARLIAAGAVSGTSVREAIGVDWRPLR